MFSRTLAAVMPDRRTHRGAAPEDAALFAPSEIERLRHAGAELVWLLNRGYATTASLKLVGDKHLLKARQRVALLRTACTDEALERRQMSRVAETAMAERPLLVDGFNVLATVEAALGGALLLRARDGCIRDLLGVHGNYRRVAESRPAIVAVGATLDELMVGSCHWLFDRPVSNSGRLRGELISISDANGWRWTASLPFSPDSELRTANAVIATSDGPILDRAVAWFNLTAATIDRLGGHPWIVDLFA